jgi:hypothetical protein
MRRRGVGMPLVRVNARGANFHSKPGIISHLFDIETNRHPGNWKKQYGLSTDNEYNFLVWPSHRSIFAIKKRRIVPCKADHTQTAYGLVDCTIDGRHPTEPAALADLYARRAFGLPMADRLRTPSFICKADGCWKSRTELRGWPDLRVVRKVEL